MKNRNTIFTTILVACFGFFPRAQAVITDPEGYFPGWNMAEGQSALFSLTTGLYNTALGGAALYSNTTGNNNTAVGLNALFHNTIGFNNTAMGAAALYYNSTGDRNTATGVAALRSNTTGDENSATGYHALYFNSTGSQNTANGHLALGSNTNGFDNTAVGSSALFRNTTGIANTATGVAALSSNTNGDANTANGWWALLNNTTGDRNTAMGGAALYRNTLGNFNIALGYTAGENVTNASNVICIGAQGANVNNSCYIGQIYGEPGGSQAVYVSAGGKLGQMVSSRRFKDEVKPMEKASEVIYGLNPVSFRYKAEIEPSRPLSFGLIAEDVEKTAPNLVTRGSDGKVNSVRYEAVNAMLLNEFLKEHKKGEEQGLTIRELKFLIAEQEKAFQSKLAEQQRQIEALASALRKVRVQLDLQKPGARAMVKY